MSHDQLTFYFTADVPLSVYCQLGPWWLEWRAASAEWERLPHRPTVQLDMVTGDREVNLLRQLAEAYMRQRLHDL